MNFAIIDAHGNPIVVRNFTEVAELMKARHASRFWHRRRRKLIDLALLAAQEELVAELRSM